MCKICIKLKRHGYYPLQLIDEIGKSRHGATSDYRPVDESVLKENQYSGSKENQYSGSKEYRNTVLIESSDDDFDQCEWADY